MDTVWTLKCGIGEVRNSDPNRWFYFLPSSGQGRHLNSVFPEMASKTLDPCGVVFVVCISENPVCKEKCVVKIPRCGEKVTLLRRRLLDLEPIRSVYHKSLLEVLFYQWGRWFPEENLTFRSLLSSSFCNLPQGLEGNVRVFHQYS